MMYCAPSSSAVISGWMPICPTMVLSRSASSLSSGPQAGGAQGSLVKFLDDDFRIQFGADDGNLGIPDVKLGENLFRDIHHPIEIAVTAGHATAAENDRAADLLAGLHHVEKVRFHGFAFEIFSAGAEIIGPCIHRTAVANDGIDAAVYGCFQRFLRISVSEGAAGGDHAINKFWHVNALSYVRG